MQTRRHALAALLAAGVMPHAARSVHAAGAEDWPKRPVTLVQGFGAGGNADSVARVMAAALAADLGEQVVVEPKPGAGGNLASETVSRAQPDGYTLILLTGGHAVSAAMYKGLRFHPVDGFAFVSLVSTFPFVIATSVGGPLGSIADVVAAARREPGRLTFSSVGVGSTQHLTGELFAGAAGIKLTHVPYRGGMQPLTDLMSGRIDLLVDTLTVTGGAVQSGTIRGLGVTSAEPWPTVPDVPPIARTLPGFEVRSWLGIAAPAGTPPAIVARLNAAVVKALATEGVRKQLETLGVQPGASTPAGMRDFVAAEVARWQGVVERAGIERL